MHRKFQWLLGLLSAQLLLAFGLSFTSTSLSAKSADLPLLAADKDKIDRLTIEGPDRAKVVLAKEAGSWNLPDAGGFPADGAKLKQMLDRLAGIKLGVPVASSSGAQERFRVGDATFERRITLGSGDRTLATIYLGTSPGMRQVHARRGDRNEVYAIELTTYDLPAKAEDWEDKNVLHSAKDDIQSIKIGGLTVERTLEATVDATLQNVIPQTGLEAAKAKAPEWHTDGLAAGESLKADALDKLADQLANLTIDSVLGRDEKTEYGLGQPVLILTLARKNGDHAEYRLGKMADGQAYALKVSTRSEYFKLPGYTAQNLIDAAKREALVETKLAASTPAPEKSAPPK